MRRVSAALNRALLAIFGLLVACAAIWVLASGLDAGHYVPGMSDYLASAQEDIGAFLSPRAHWLVPLVLLASVLAFLLGLLLLLMQVPRRPANSSLRISGSDGTLLAVLPPRSCRRPFRSGRRAFPVSSDAPSLSPVPRASSGFRRIRASRRTVRSSGLSLNCASSSIATWKCLSALLPSSSMSSCGWRAP